MDITDLEQFWVDYKPLIITVGLGVISSIIAAFIWEKFIKKKKSPKTSLSTDTHYTEQLPATDSNFFVGREAELQLLDDTWANQEINILVIQAWGGSGKSALINKWLDKHAKEDWKNIPKAFAWSFANQGDIYGKKQTSSTKFIDHALTYFNSDKQSFSSEYEKGQHLAKLIGKHRCLLILDGLEPFQYFAEGDDDNDIFGQLRDRGLQGLLETLAKQNAGLCLCLTRTPLENAFASNSSVKHHQLKKLSSDDCIAFLKRKGLKNGKKEDFEALVKKLDNHMFSLTLMANYLLDYCKGDIRQQDIINLLDETTIQQQGAVSSAQACATMEAYEKQLMHTPALALLYVCSVFNHPIEKEIIDELISLAVDKQKIGLNKQLLQLEQPAQWKRAIKILTRADLLSYDKETQLLKIHPLTQQYYSQSLEEKREVEWKRINRELYVYYKDSAKELPDTLKEMEPLFAAVGHGCAAGLHQQVLDEVYYPYIRRDGDTNIIHKLGAFGVDLSLLSHFFEADQTNQLITIGLKKPAEGLSDNAKASIFGWVAFCLRAIGRLEEALQPMQTSLEMSIKQKDWMNATVNAQNISELQLTRGRLIQGLELQNDSKATNEPSAIKAAKQSVEFADKCGEEFQRISSRILLGNALHQVGDLAFARQHFVEAKKLEDQCLQTSSQFFFFGGFNYCDLLLALGEWREVQRLVQSLLDCRADDDLLLANSLEYLSLGRASLQPVVEKILLLVKGMNNTRNITDYFSCVFVSVVDKKVEITNLKTVKDWLNQAVNGLHAAGQEWFLPNGLLARANYYRWCLSLCDLDKAALQEVYQNALDDLNETYNMSKRSGMLLHLTDYHLESARLALVVALLAEQGRSVFSQSPPSDSFQGSDVEELSIVEHIAKAKALIEKTGYKRRSPELEYLEEFVLNEE